VIRKIEDDILPEDDDLQNELHELRLKFMKETGKYEEQNAYNRAYFTAVSIMQLLNSYRMILQN
jgi:hypothetical protein